MSKMSERWANIEDAKALIEAEGGHVIMKATPDEIVQNHLGGALHSLMLARSAVREGGHYRQETDAAIRLAREMLDEIGAAWVETKRDAEAA